MPYKRRDGGPKAREPQITPAAVALYERAQKLLRKPQSDARDQILSDLGFDIAAELKLKPWVPNIFNVVGYSKPEPYEDADDWWKVAELAEQLEAAVKAKRKAEREARRAKPAA
jgi:hypothetical protein